MLLWRLHRGDAPLLINVPHAGRHVPDALALRMTDAALALPDTDWHMDELSGFARAAGMTLMVATHSRYVVDLNRDPSGAALYPGADNTELCPSRTFDLEPIYRAREAPSHLELAARRAVYFDPYHAQLASEIAKLRRRHGHAVVLDLHSIRSHVPRFFDGRIPDLNLGTANGLSCAADVCRLARDLLAAATPLTHVVDGRFKGGYITRHYGNPADGVHALQLETAQSAYMDEAPPYRYDPLRAAPMQDLLERLVVAIAEWRPPSR